MTTFQLVALSLFLLLVVAAYGPELLAVVKKLTAGVGAGVSSSQPVLGSRERVNDMLMVSSLRDRLSAVNCTTGVEACTLLLRAIVDHTNATVDHTRCGK